MSPFTLVMDIYCSLAWCGGLGWQVLHRYPGSHALLPPPPVGTPAEAVPWESLPHFPLWEGTSGRRQGAESKAPVQHCGPISLHCARPLSYCRCPSLVLMWGSYSYNDIKRKMGKLTFYPTSPQRPRQQSHRPWWLEVSGSQKQKSNFFKHRQNSRARLEAAFHLSLLIRIASQFPPYNHLTRKCVNWDFM